MIVVEVLLVLVQVDYRLQIVLREIDPKLLALNIEFIDSYHTSVLVVNIYQIILKLQLQVSLLVQVEALGLTQILGVARLSDRAHVVEIVLQDCRLW